VAFNQSMTYVQYFELYDIMNELNLANDILTRFLKVYHILEYLVYRVEMVDIEKKARNNRTFIREINSLIGKGQLEKELPLLRKNFAVIFSAELSTSHFDLNLTNSETDFMKLKLGLNQYKPREAASVSDLIYRVRNSIVHNKESEFHLTLTNPADYSDFISPIKKLIQKLEKGIFDKISMNDPQIGYGSSTIKLY
jgi:hypothetical protein